MIGTRVTSLIDRAAPPRASPSSLVRITPLSSSASLNALALLTASWPVMASQTGRPGPACTTLVDLPQLVHRHFGDVQPAGRVEDDRVEQRLPGVGDARCGRHPRGRVLPSRLLAVDRNLDLLAEHFELIDGGGPLQVGGDEQRLAAALAQGQGELAGGGRLAASLEGRTA